MYSKYQHFSFEYRKYQHFSVRYRNYQHLAIESSIESTNSFLVSYMYQHFSFKYQKYQHPLFEYQKYQHPLLKYRSIIFFYSSVQQISFQYQRYQHLSCIICVNTFHSNIESIKTLHSSTVKRGYSGIRGYLGTSHFFML